MIVPACPAVVNLIELRFPSLVGLLAPFDSPWEAVVASGGGRPLACVVSCPSQRSVLAQEQTPAAGGDAAPSSNAFCPTPSVSRSCGS